MTTSLLVVAAACGDSDDGAEAANDGAPSPLADSGTDARVDVPEGSSAVDAGEAGVSTFAITLGQTAYSVTRGATLNVDLTLQRPPDAHAVTVAISGLGAGVTADPLVIAAGSATGTLALKTTATTPTLGSTVSLDAFDGTKHGTITFALQVRGLPGEPDDGFGTDGTSAIALDREPYPMSAAVTNGKLIILTRRTAKISDAVEPTVVRLDEHGALDPTYGTGGSVSFEGDGGTESGPDAILVAPDGSALLVGRTVFTPSGGAIFMRRLDATGAIDATYKGETSLASTSLNRATAIAPGPNGSALLSGMANDSSGVFIRLTANGALDTTFGAGTGVEPLLPAFIDHVPDAIDTYAIGAFVFAGYAGSNKGEVGRRLLDGEIDPTFGPDGGVVKIDLGTHVTISKVALVDGGVAVTGYSIPTDAYVPYVGWFSSTGAPGPQLDAGDLSGTRPIATAVAPDGKLLVLVESSDSTQAGILRFSTPGTLDPTFGVGGVRTFGGGLNAGAIAVTPDGRVVVVGNVTSGTTVSLVAARLWL